jgi:hypothetical protein
MSSSSEIIDTSSVADSAASAPQMSLEVLVTSLKSLESAELFKVMKQALNEAEKRIKSTASRGKVSSSPKKGSMPKGVSPPQLRKPRAWVDFTLKHARENGWESFVIHQKKKDKVTGVVEEEEIEMTGSVLHNGVHIHEGSINEKKPEGRQIIHKEAMSLSKQRWNPKEKTGTHPELYAEFEASYVEEESEVEETASESGSKVVVRKTAAEKEAEKEAKKAAKEAEKEAKKAAKEAEKEAKKAAKEAEKEAKKAVKEADKEAKKTTKATNVGVPAAAVKKAVASSVSEEKPIAAVKTTVKKAAPTVAVKKEEWSCPADGMVHVWPYKGKQYLRNSDNEVWLKAADGGCGEWQGIYLPGEDRIDDSIPEPEFEDEE